MELPRELARATRAGAQLSVAMIDMDHFKLFNDRDGHPAGDRLLSTAAALWSRELRAADLLARYGGEEFGLLMPGTGGSHATTVLERLQVATPEDMTVSIGCAEWDGSESPSALVERADASLYTAKRAGRNRIAYSESA